MSYHFWQMLEFYSLVFYRNEAYLISTDDFVCVCVFFFH